MRLIIYWLQSMLYLRSSLLRYFTPSLPIVIILLPTHRIIWIWLLLPLLLRNHRILAAIPPFPRVLDGAIKWMLVSRYLVRIIILWLKIIVASFMVIVILSIFVLLIVLIPVFRSIRIFDSSLFLLFQGKDILDPILFIWIAI